MPANPSPTKPTVTIPFQTIMLPTSQSAILPAGFELRFPTGAEITPLTPWEQCAIAYIPWNDHFISHIPPVYHDFFMFVLPSMHARTTNVHTALSVSQLPALIPADTNPDTVHLIYAALILHDIGWSKVSFQGIADSLSYSGLSISELSKASKQQHVTDGAELAATLLEAYDFKEFSFSAADRQHIIDIISHHDYDASWSNVPYSLITPETNIVCDADRLWSYTHENFWQDTVRKHVQPETYLHTITGAIDTYFFTDRGKTQARRLIADRQREVQLYSHYVARQAVQAQ
jgi:hypothetical protein